jgi:hypothetical protein
MSFNSVQKCLSLKAPFINILKNILFLIVVSIFIYCKQLGWSEKIARAWNDMRQITFLSILVMVYEPKYKHREE